MVKMNLSVAELLASMANLNLSVSEESETNDAYPLLSGILSELSTNEIQDQNQLDIPSEIYALLQKLDSLDVKDWSNLDLNAATNFLKLAKLQDLLSSQKELSQDAAIDAKRNQESIRIDFWKARKMVEQSTN